MALDKSNKDYYYNLGRCVAIVGIMVGKEDLYERTCINPDASLPYHLVKALSNERHNLHAELLPVAEIVLDPKTEIPSFISTADGKAGNFSLGYNHQKKYLEEKYHGIFGKEETSVTEKIPEVIAPVEDNYVECLTR